MRRFSLIFSLLILSSCSKESETFELVDLSVQTLTGEWQLTRKYVSPGGEATWENVKNGPIYKFSADNTFQYSEEHCLSGTYSLNDDTLNLICSDSDEIRSYHISEITTGSLEISFTGCIESCIYYYEKR